MWQSRVGRGTWLRESRVCLSVQCKQCKQSKQRKQSKQNKQNKQNKQSKQSKQHQAKQATEINNDKTLAQRSLTRCSPSTP